MVGYAVRISRTAEELYDVMLRWKDYCDEIVMYEHNENANRIHCHIYLGGCDITTKRLKQVSGLPNQGNTLWSFKQATEDISIYITYMSKGKYDPYYLHGYEFKDCERLRQLWREPPVKVSKSLKEYMEFKEATRELPLEHRMHKEDIERIATRWVFNRDKMFNMVNQNHIKNYTASYCFEYKILSRPLV